MNRVVVVSTADVNRSALTGLVEPTDELIVVVPAVEQSKLQWLANDEDEARRQAHEVGERVAEEAPAAAARIDVTPDVPRQAVLDAIAEHAPDLVIVALREGDDATWLEEGDLAAVPGEIEGVRVERLRI